MVNIGDKWALFSIEPQFLFSDDTHFTLGCIDFSKVDLGLFNTTHTCPDTQRENIHALCSFTHTCILAPSAHSLLCTPNLSTHSYTYTFTHTYIQSHICSHTHIGSHKHSHT